MPREDAMARRSMALAARRARSTHRSGAVLAAVRIASPLGHASDAIRPAGFSYVICAGHP